MNDEHLLVKAKQLDPAALREIHHRYYEAVARYVQFKVGDPQTVEDLCGEVFVRVIEALKRGRGWQDSPQGWIVGIARHVVADHYRKREKVQEVILSDQLTANGEGDPVAQALKGDQRRQLLQAMQSLTEDQRDVISMRFIRGMNIEAVAQAINKSPGAVKGLQFRALRVLAERLADAPAEGSSS